MYAIYKNRKIVVNLVVVRNHGRKIEKFDNALLKVFADNGINRYNVDYSLIDENLIVSFAEGMPCGTYSISAVWTKNRSMFVENEEGCEHLKDRNIQRCDADNIFSVVDNIEDDTMPSKEGQANLKVTASADIFGTDGLSSYEIAVLRGLWFGDELSYIKNTIKVDIDGLVNEMLLRGFYTDSDAERDLLALKTELESEIGNAATKLELASAINESKESLKEWVEDKGYLTEHQSLDNYYTKVDIDSKGYLTEHQSLANYYTKSETYNKTEVDTKISQAGVPAEFSTKLNTLWDMFGIDNDGKIYLKEGRSLYTLGAITALGVGSGSGGGSGINISAVWEALGNSDTSKQISISHLTTALQGYVKSADISGFATKSELQSESAARSSADTALGGRIDSLGDRIDVFESMFEIVDGRIHAKKDLYGNALTALGYGSGSASGGTDMATVWASLANNDSSKQINIAHLSDALNSALQGYAKTTDIPTDYCTTSALAAEVNARSTADTALSNRITEFRTLFDSMFELSNGKIHAKLDLYGNALTALGMGSGSSGGGIDITQVWQSLSSDDPTKQISYSHISNAIESPLGEKQDVIDDLDAIRSGSLLGATSIQTHQDISGKANVSDLGTMAYKESTDYLEIIGGTLTGNLLGVNASFNKVYTPRIVFADGAVLEYDETNDCIRASVGIYSEDFITAYGFTTSSGEHSASDLFVKSVSVNNGKIKVVYDDISYTDKLTNIESRLQELESKIA